MKKFLAIAMTLCFFVALAACQQSNQTKKQSEDATQNSHQQHPGTPSNKTQKKDENGSHSSH